MSRNAFSVTIPNRVDSEKTKEGIGNEIYQVIRT